MPTNRTPRRHGPRSNRFTPEILEAFRVMENAESEHSEEWEAADRYIRRALKLPPWHFPSARAGEPGSDTLPAKLHAELKRASDGSPALAARRRTPRRVRGGGPVRS